MAGFQKRRRARGGDGDRPTALERGKMRRRLRRQQRVREALLLDLGALVFELHRQGRREPELLQTKAAQLTEVDQEVRALADALEEDRTVLQLVAAGIAGSCDSCGALLTADARYCSACGASTGLALPAERARREEAAPEIGGDGDGAAVDREAATPWQEEPASLETAAAEREPVTEEEDTEAAEAEEAPEAEEPEEAAEAEEEAEEAVVEETVKEGRAPEQEPVAAEERPPGFTPPWGRPAADAEVAGPTVETRRPDAESWERRAPAAGAPEPLADRALRTLRIGLRRGRKWLESRRSGGA